MTRLLTTLFLLLLLVALGGCTDDTVPDRAADALECETTYAKGTGDDDTDPAVPEDDAEAAFDRWLDGHATWTTDLDLVAETDDRALWVREHEELDIYAVVVVDGTTMAGEDGWYVESWAMCDPAYFPEEETEAAGLGIWTDTNGYRQPVDTVQTFPGPEHCGWEDIDFLMLGGHRGRAFLRDTEGLLQRSLATTYAADVAVPGDAEDTGWSRDGRRLWLADDAAYLVDADGRAERWPGETEPIRCA